MALSGPQEMEFRYQQEEAAASYCTRLAAAAHLYPPDKGAAEAYGDAHARSSPDGSPDGAARPA